MSRIVLPLLAFLAIGLAGIIAIEAIPPKLQAAGPPPSAFIRLGPNAPHSADMRQVQAWVDTIIARPLFEPSRRPPAAAARPGSSLPGFPRLTGIIILPQRREAIFAAPGENHPLVVTVGSRLNGVLIKSIDAGGVVIVDGAGVRIIRPSFAAAGTAAQPTPTPGSAPTRIDLPPLAPSSSQASPFASIPGLSGRPLGLAAQPDSAIPSLPALASPGVSP